MLPLLNALMKHIPALIGSAIGSDVLSHSNGWQCIVYTEHTKNLILPLDNCCSKPSGRVIFDNVVPLGSELFHHLITHFVRVYAVAVHQNTLVVGRLAGNSIENGIIGRIRSSFEPEVFVNFEFMVEQNEIATPTLNALFFQVEVFHIALLSKTIDRLH